MNYLILDSDIYYETGEKSGRISGQDIGTVFTGEDKTVSVAVVETLQKHLAAPEKDTFSRDQLIAESFGSEYVTQSEQIGNNFFQVIAIEKAKVNEIYKCLGFENVRRIVPYAVALREFLKINNLLDVEKRGIFLDYLNPAVLLTIFHEDAFTTPRRLALNNRIPIEITRSQENYRNLNKDANGVDFLIITNSKDIKDKIVASGLEANENITLVKDPYPALTGLRQGKFSMHYLLPEQFIRLRRAKEIKKRFLSLGVMAAILSVFLAVFAVSFGINKDRRLALKDLQLKERSESEKLKQAYTAKYRDMVRRGVKINFDDYLESFINAVPDEYKIESIVMRKISSGVFRFEAVVLADDDRSCSAFVLPQHFRQAKIENILVKGNPGVRVMLDIF